MIRTFKRALHLNMLFMAAFFSGKKTQAAGGANDGIIQMRADVIGM